MRVTSGDYATDKLVASPVQVLRAAMRLYRWLGLPGFVLGVMDGYTGSRWGELAGQQRHEYDSEHRAITIHSPLKEVNGVLYKAGRRIDQSTDDVLVSFPAPARSDVRGRRPRR